MQSEDDPQRQLLETRITKDDGYQKQQGSDATEDAPSVGRNLYRSADTLIVWTEPNGIDMALSFQEAEGCAAIWYGKGPVATWCTML